MRKLIINAAASDENLQMIKETGWDGVFTGWYPEAEALARTIRDLGLVYQSIHAPFQNIYALWEEGEAGDLELKKQIDCIKTAASVGVDLVVIHPNIGFDRHSPNELGIERFGTVFKAAKKLDVRVAVENVEGEEYLHALMDAFPDEPHVGFCIDTGHEMCYDFGHDLIGTYGRRLFGTHLNDNMGMTGASPTWLDDSHLLPFEGVADWNGIAERLNRAEYKGMLTFELIRRNRPNRHTSDRYEQMTYAEFIRAALERAREFADLIGD